MSEDVILQHLLEQTQSLGKIESCLETVKGDVHQLGENQKKLATKKDVHSKIDTAIGEHEQAYHPTKEEKVGKQVLTLWDQLFHTKKGQTISAGSLIGGVLLLLEYLGVLS